MSKKTILVTGSEGYIGNILVGVLLKKKYNVIGIDTCLYTSELGEHSLLPYNLLKKDIRQLTSSDLKGIDSIIHLAALSNDPLGEITPNLTRDINLKGTIELAKKAKKAGVKRFIFSSSCSVYGKAERGVVDEQSMVTPLTEYARSKVEAETFLRQLADDNFYVVLLRNSTVYGYSLKFRDDLVANNLLSTAYVSGEIRIKSDGTPWRPLIDVRDLATIFSEAITLSDPQYNGEIINSGFDENNLQVKDILSIIKKIIPSSRIIYTGEHGSDSRSYRVSFKKFRTIFPGLKQKWPLEKSMKHLLTMLKKGGYSSTKQKQGAYTRLSTIKQLLHEGKITNDLYWSNFL